MSDFKAESLRATRRNAESRQRWRGPLLALLVALAPAIVVFAQDPSPQAAGESQTPEVPAAAGKPAASAPARPPSPDPCETRSLGKEPRLDQLRREIFETVCESAAWFDGFFGSRRFDEEARRTHGRAGLRTIWDEHDGFELDGKLKVRVNFPNLDHRVDAFFGREERNEVLTGFENDLDFLPDFFERQGNEEWLLGLGYHPVNSKRSSLGFDVGMNIDTSPEPFVRSSYRHFWLIGNEHLLRARQTVYWTTEKGVGTSTRIDFERPLGRRTLARWSSGMVFDDETEGGDWDTGITLYRGFSRDRGLSWYVGIDGETAKEVPLETYGTRVVYRQRMLRQWFFGEIIGGVTWPRDTLADERRAAYHIGFGFDIQFSGEDLGAGRRR